MTRSSASSIPVAVWATWGTTTSGGVSGRGTDHERTQPEDELDDLDDGPHRGRPGQGRVASSSVAPPGAA